MFESASDGGDGLSELVAPPEGKHCNQRERLLNVLGCVDDDDDVPADATLGASPAGCTGMDEGLW